MTLTLLLVSGCTSTAVAPTGAGATGSSTPQPSLTASPSSTPNPTSTVPPTDVPSATAVPTVDSLKATVTADLLSCRYGPGPNYLFLYGLRKGANIELIGRADEDNWHWVYVQGKSKCWVNTNFIEVHGDWKRLPIVYPGLARLPVSPYYPPTSVLSVVRNRDQVTVEWADIPLRAGDEEDQFMQHYIVEVWRCENGRLLFEPLATNELSVTFTDQAGCGMPSHGRIFVQEKHGLSGPTEIAWPPHK
jgi:uncharacterized protein YraI